MQKYVLDLLEVVQWEDEHQENNLSTLSPYLCKFTFCCFS